MSYETLEVLDCVAKQTDLFIKDFLFEVGLQERKKIYGPLRAHFTRCGTVLMWKVRFIWDRDCRLWSAACIMKSGILLRMTVSRKTE